MGLSAIAGAAVIGTVGSIYGASQSADAASHSADVQAAAGREASANTYAMFERMRSDLAPYRALGIGPADQIQQLTGSYPGGNPLTSYLTKPFTGQDLASTPGYQFTLDQGLKATQNALGAQGLGSSGSAVKAAAQYAQGLAGTTYNDQFKNTLAQQQQIYNMLGGQISTGQNAAAQTGNAGMNAASTSAGLLTGAAAAQGAGGVGVANAWNQGISGATNNLMQGSVLGGMYNKGVGLFG